MTDPNNLLDDILGFDEGPDPFEVFASNAWKPYEKWDSEPMTREQFADRLFELYQSKAHEVRAATLSRFADQVALRLGGGKALNVDIGNETSYNYNPNTETSTLILDYRTTLVGETANRQLNAFIGLLVRGIYEHLMNQEGSTVREFMQSIEHDFDKFKLPDIGDYAAQQAKIALTDRAISADLMDTWPGFAKYALDGLYELQAVGSQQRFGEIEDILKSGKDPEGKEITRQDRKKYELEMASQYLQACTTAPGRTVIDSGKYSWAVDIEQAGMMYRNISNLEMDAEYAARGNDIYSKVVERILDLPDDQPDPEEGEGMPDLSKLQSYYEDLSGSADAAGEAKKTNSSFENAANSMGTDRNVKFDAEKFQKLKDQEPETHDERTPWAEGNPILSYYTIKAKSGPVARARYAATKSNYAPQIRKLRALIEDQYTVRMQTERGLKSGRPDASRLVSLKFGKTDVFKQDTPDITGEPIDVVLLIDESGSMSASVKADGYKPVGKFVPEPDPSIGYYNRNVEMAGIEADSNLAAEDGGGNRIDVARSMGVVLHEAVRGLEGIRMWSLGYTTGDRSDFGLPRSKSGGWGDSQVRYLSNPKDPFGVALSVAHGGNADAEALHEAVKLLEKESNGARKAIIYLADGGISDPKLESMLKNIQRKIPVYFIDMSNSVRGTDGSLKIDHSVTVNSMNEAIRGVGKFFRDIVLA